ncbi:MAG: molybdopterin-dependent oxidoreductase, partial [bacterium]
NIRIQTLRDEVERVLPVENEDVNECWLADRDRYSYEAANSESRLTRPMIKDADGWKEVHWQVALKHAAAGLQAVIDSGSSDDIGALAAASSTLEEFYLMQKLARGLGSGNIDHRLQQQDFNDDDIAPMFPALEIPIVKLSTAKAALLVGANLRKEQPLLSVRLRHAVVKHGAKVGSINVMNYPQTFDLVDNQVTSPGDVVNALAATAKQVAEITDASLPSEIDALTAGTANRDIAAALVEAGSEGVVIIGANAQQHANASSLRAISQWIAEQTGAAVGVLAPANSAAGWVAGCVPHRGANNIACETGMNAGQMLDQGRRAFILLGIEPELDALNAEAASRAMHQAEFVVQISAFKSDSVMQYADVILPMAPFTEAAGTYINCEGRIQRSTVAATPKDEARPAWKILRVLGNFMEVEGFNYVTSEDVLNELGLGTLKPEARLSGWRLNNADATSADGLQRVVDMPMYRGEITLRHANALQLTADNPPPAARVHPNTIDKLNLTDAQSVSVVNGSGVTTLPLHADKKVPLECVYIPAGFNKTAAIGTGGTVTLSPQGDAS